MLYTTTTTPSSSMLLLSSLLLIVVILSPSAVSSFSTIPSRTTLSTRRINSDDNNILTTTTSLAGRRRSKDNKNRSFERRLNSEYSIVIDKKSDRDNKNKKNSDNGYEVVDDSNSNKDNKNEIYYDDGDEDEYDYDDEYYSDDDDNAQRSSSAPSTASIVPKSYFFSQKDLFDPSFQLNSKIFTKLCTSLKLEQPSRIQTLAWPTLIKGTHTLIADQTGSGKTLAYLFPLIQRALSSTENEVNGTPKILVLAPTSELADQIYNVCEQIRETALPELRTMMVIGASGDATVSIRGQMRQIERNPITIMVSTPGRIATILRSKSNPLNLSKLQAMVLDEVDVLLAQRAGSEDDNSGRDSSDFGFQLRTISAAAPRDLTKLQFVFVTATLPEKIAQTVENEFGRIGLKQIRGPGLHRISPTLEQKLVDVSVYDESARRDKKSGESIKLEQLKRVLRERKCRRTLVFCNTVESCRTVENALNRQYKKNYDVTIGAYHNAMTFQSRNRNLRTFTNFRQRRKQQQIEEARQKQQQQPQQQRGGRGNNNNFYNNKKKNPTTEKEVTVTDEDNSDHILICTDRASRGVDFDGTNVDHVVVYDFPKDPAEYVRRVGRTARAGRNGYATIMAYGWQLPIARTLMKSQDKKKVNESLMQQDEQYQFTYENEDDEYGAKARANKQRGKNKNKNKIYSEEEMIKGNIEGGKLWSKK